MARHAPHPGGHQDAEALLPLGQQPEGVLIGPAQPQGAAVKQLCHEQFFTPKPPSLHLCTESPWCHQSKRPICSACESNRQPMPDAAPVVANVDGQHILRAIQAERPQQVRQRMPLVPLDLECRVSHAERLAIWQRNRVTVQSQQVECRADMWTGSWKERG